MDSETQLWPPSPSDAPLAARGDDLEAALQAAETLQAGADRYLSTARLVVSIAAAATAIAVGVAVGEAATSHWVGAVISGAAIVANAFGAVMIVVRLQRTRDLRQSLAIAIVVMVREVAADVFEQEQWSHVKRRAMTVRLSSFPIQPVNGDDSPALSHRLRLGRRAAR